MLERAEEVIKTEEGKESAEMPPREDGNPRTVEPEEGIEKGTLEEETPEEVNQDEETRKEASLAAPTNTSSEPALQSHENSDVNPVGNKQPVDPSPPVPPAAPEDKMEIVTSALASRNSDNDDIVI